ncbi:MAG: tRNA (cytidine(34)-2'-O)-methyltransferase [Bacillales bacterium]|nr:tRNA (cytidine(34)-2'-O)-methyltransferase [Bacillales bacterium]
MIHIVLFQPEIPANTGNIFRTAMAIGAKVHLIRPLGFEINEKSLKRAGMDYFDEVDYTIYDNIDDFYKKNKNAKIYYVTRYASTTYDSNDYSDFTEDIYFMFGRESTGIPHDILRTNEEYLIRIPMVKNARSLNLSNSVAIVVYEASRQQEFFSLSTIEAIKGEDFLEREIKNK